MDDILHTYTRNNDFIRITDRLNNIEPSYDLTYELKTNIIHFLVILLTDNNNRLEFKVHNKFI